MPANSIKFMLSSGLCAIMLTACAMDARPTSMSAADSKALYDTRYARFMADPGNFTYDFMEPLAGAVPFTAVPRGGAGAFKGEALAQASAYAAANQSTAFMVWHDGQVAAEAYGQGITATTPLMAKSLAKPLTAIVVGRAMALGKIKSLDQVIADFIPELKGKPKGSIQIRHLLDMRSGLLEQAFVADPESPLNRAYLDADHGRYLVEQYPMTHAPGTHYGYANATSELVAVVIEAATGRRYTEFVNDEVLVPLGAMGGEQWVSSPGGLAHSGCCITMPAESWLRLGALLAQDGVWQGRRLLPKGYVTAMATGTPQNPNYGLGLWLGEPYREYRGFGAPDAPGPKVYQSAPYADAGMFLFDGNGSQTVHISRKHHLVVLRMGPNPPKEAGWDNAYLPNLLIGALNR